MTYGIKDLTEYFGVGQHTVLNWIHCGELKAIDVSRNRGGRPKWRVTVESREAFELLRTPSPAPPRTRRRRQSAGVIDFY